MSRRTMLKWAAGLLAALLLAALAAALLLPGLINTDLVRTKIESSISRDLGGTLTYDSTSLSILPRPRIRVVNAKIVVPGKVSAAFAALDIRPLVLPLLRGRFQASSVHIEGPAADIILPDASTPSAKRRAPQPDQGSPLDQVLAVAARQMPGIAISIDRGSLAVTRSGRQVLSARELHADILFSDTAETAAAYQVDGSARCVIEVAGVTQAPITLSLDQFRLVPGVLSFSRTRMRMDDLTLSLTGKLDQYLSSRLSADIALSGKAGTMVLQRAGERASVPPLLLPKAPLAFDDVRVAWNGTVLRIAGKASVAGGPSLALDVLHTAETLSVRQLTVSDQASSATISFAKSAHAAELSFTGNLTARTVADLFGHEQFRFGSVRGDLRVRVPFNDPGAFTAEGGLETEQLAVPWKRRVPLTIDRLRLTAREREVRLDPAAVTLGSSHAVVTGSIGSARKSLTIDLGLSSREVLWSDLQELFRKPAGEPVEDREQERSSVDLSGQIQVNVDALRVDRFTARQVTGAIGLEKGRTTVEVENANVCGITITGDLRTLDQGAEVGLALSAKGGKVEETVPCVMTDGPDITGAFDLAGSFTGRGPWDKLVPSLQGTLEVYASDGRIKGSRIVKGIIAYLNSTSLLKSSHASLQQEGVPFETIVFRGNIREGTIAMQQGLVKGRDIHLAAEGAFDLRRDTVDLKVLAAPFTTMDRLLGSIPIVKQLVGNALIVVPAKVEGPFKEPVVKPLATESVGTNISNLMKNIVEAPVKIIDPALPRGRKRNEP